MKKIFSFFAAALLSVSMFATPEKVPAVADLASSFDVANNVVWAVFFEEGAPVCNDIVLAGSYNEWSDNPENCIKFVALEGFEGWWAAEVEWVEGLQCKPLQLGQDGTFHGWDYQPGGADAWVNVGGEGAKEAQIETNGYGDEANVTLPEAGAYIYAISRFKNENIPCSVIVKHDYKIVLYAPVCEGQEFKPAIIGAAVGGWGSSIEMNEDLDEEMNTIYTYEIKGGEVGSEFKFRQAGIEDWSNQIQEFIAPEEEGAAGTWKDLGNLKLEDGEGDVIVLTFHFDDPEKYKWSLCGADDNEYDVLVTVIVPAGAPAAGIELIGDFCNWEEAPVLMTAGENNSYSATVKAKAAQKFKFREAGTWDNEILQWVAGEGEGEGEWKAFADFIFGEKWNEADHSVSLDFSDAAKFAWKVPAGIEDLVIVAGEKAQKVMIDGHVYIIRENAIYNVVGAQVR